MFEHNQIFPAVAPIQVVLIDFEKRSRPSVAHESLLHWEDVRGHHWTDFALYLHGTHTDSDLWKEVCM